MMEILSINNILFTFWGYEMSYLEFFGTLFNLWCVWLVAKNNILTWPVGIVGIILFAFLFWQIQLYADFFEQIYFFVMSIYGWWLWTDTEMTQKTRTKKELKISQNFKKTNRIYVIAIVVGTIVMGCAMSHINNYLPKYFPAPASFPYLDSFTTVMSFAATILMAKKKIECWYLWIFVDVIGIALYFAKGVILISMLYALFLILAIKGYLNWKKELEEYEK